MSVFARTPLSPRTSGILAMLGAMVIYGANFPISRHGIQQGLTAADMNILRYGIAGVLMLPILLRAGLKDCAGLGWGRGLALTAMSGFPVGLMMMLGLSLAPASHGAAIGPGTVTVVGIIGGRLLFGIKPTVPALAGVGCVLAGLAAIAAASSASGTTTMVLGDLCFLAVGLVWGSYPLVLMLWKVNPLQATAILSVLSAVIYGPYYAMTEGAHLFTLPWPLLLLHGFNQGVMNVIAGLWLWGWGLGKLGVSVAGRFPPLIPVIGTVVGIPLLGEWPGPLQWLGIGLIVAGLLVTTIRPASTPP
jgi:drug/metabolite transporter (DMT)-like permease